MSTPSMPQETVTMPSRILRASIVVSKRKGTKNCNCSGRATRAVAIFLQRLALFGAA